MANFGNGVFRKLQILADPHPVYTLLGSAEFVVLNIKVAR